MSPTANELCLVGLKTTAAWQGSDGDSKKAVQKSLQLRLRLWKHNIPLRCRFLLNNVAQFNFKFKFNSARPQEGRKKGTVVLIHAKDIEPVEGQVAVPFVSDRRGYNFVKIAAIIREVLQSSSAERIVLANLKSLNINDNHLYRLRLAKYASEISSFFSIAYTEPRQVSSAANLFRLNISDKITAKTVLPPKMASEADYEEAAKWVHQQYKKQGSLLKACNDWLTHRNVELVWWRLQQHHARMFKEQDAAVIVNRGGRRGHMSDAVFLKYVVPVMQSSGPLKHSVESWMDCMCAVDMLQNVRQIVHARSCLFTLFHFFIWI